MAAYIDKDGKPLFWAQTIPAWVNDPERQARIKHAWNQWNKIKNTLEVRKLTDGDIIIRKKQNPSAVTAYQVPTRILDTLLNAEEEIPENVSDLLYEILWKLDDKGTARDLEQFVKGDEDGFLPTYRQVYTAITAESPLISQQGAVMLRRGLKNLGYNGIRYQGGITKGNIRHEAYVFWDEQGLKKLAMN